MRVWGFPKIKCKGSKSLYVFVCVCVSHPSIMHELLLPERTEKFLLWMEARAALHIGCASIRKATKWFPWWLQLRPVPRILPVDPANSLGHGRFLWLSSIRATKIPYKCMKCPKFFPWKEGFCRCKAECRRYYTSLLLLARTGGRSVYVAHL